MSYTKIAAVFADSESLSGQEITVGGWARTIRDMKNFGFVELNDGSCFRNLQVVMEAGALENYKDIAAQNVGAALIVTGTVVLTPDAKQPLELKASAIQVEGTSTPDYPLQKKRHSVEFLRTIQHLRPRTCSPPPSASGARRPTRFTTSSRAGALSTSTPPSSLPATARAQARCSGSAPWIPRTRP